jgi:hypothetical protein
VDHDAIERTAERVRGILEAAEHSAAEMRADATRQAGEHIARVEDSAARLLARVDEIEALLDALRAQLAESVARLRDEAGLAPPEEDFAAAAPATVDEPAAADEAPAAAAPEESPAAAAPDESPAAAAPDESSAPVNGDEAGARLIALNMALAGKPREEAAAYLAERFRLANVEALLDDVYQRAGR